MCVCVERELELEELIRLGAHEYVLQSQRIERKKRFANLVDETARGVILGCERGARGGGGGDRRTEKKTTEYSP